MMNCSNCGAPQALAADETHFVCEHCGSLYFPNENQDKVRVIGTTSEVDCPVCKVPLVLGWINNTRVRACKRCRGLLIRSAEFPRTIEFLRADLNQPPVTSAPLDTDQLQRQLACPRCGVEMHTHPYAGPGNVVIDNCADCGVNWLDHNEINRIVRSPDRRRKEERWADWDVPLEGDIPEIGS